MVTTSCRHSLYPCGGWHQRRRNKRERYDLDVDYCSGLLIPIESALLNIRAVQEVLDAQSLQYIFPYSSFSFDTDLNFILLAEGRKSTFFQVRPFRRVLVTQQQHRHIQTHFNIPLQPASDVPLDELKTRLYKPRDALSIPPNEKLAKFRQLVCSAKIGNPSLEQPAAHVRIPKKLFEFRISHVPA